MDIPHGEFATRHIDWEIDPRDPRQILDIAVAAVFTWRDRARRFTGRRIRRRPCHLAHQRIFLVGGSRQRWHSIRIGRNQGRLPRVPFGQQCRRRRAADQSGVNESGELDVLNMARLGVDALKVPNRLTGRGIVIREKAAPVFFGKNARKSPFRVAEHTDIDNIHH